MLHSQLPSLPPGLPSQQLRKDGAWGEMAEVKREIFGHMPPEDGGGEVEKFVLQSDSVRVEILSFGCIIAALETRDRAKQFADIVLGFDTLEGGS